MKLSKREMVMLIFLIIVSVLFIEYRFVILPGIVRFDELTNKKMQTQDRVNTIKLNLAIAKKNEMQRDDNVDAIKELANHYFSELQIDAILVRTHDLVLENGFDPSQYQLSAITAASLETHIYDSYDMSYALKELAQTYQSLRKPKTNDDIEITEEPGVANAQVEQYQIAFSAMGTYNQVKSFLDSITSIQRSVVVSSISLIPDLTLPDTLPSPDPGTVIEPTPTPEVTKPEEQLLSVNMTLYYYGLAKLIPEADEFNKWYRDPFVPVTYTPFKQPPSPTPIIPVETEVTVPTT